MVQFIGVILSGLGLLEGARAQRAQTRFQGKVAKANQKSAEMEADYARDIAHKKSGEKKQQARRLASKLRAAQASSRLEGERYLTSGKPMEGSFKRRQLCQLEI